jgi:hypothetical protein
MTPGDYNLIAECIKDQLVAARNDEQREAERAVLFALATDLAHEIDRKAGFNPARSGFVKRFLNSCGFTDSQKSTPA